MEKQLMLMLNRSPYECNPEASFDTFIDELLQICNIDGRVNPFDAHYQFMENIGQGSQAAVNIFTEVKLNRGRTRRKHRAVKTYTRMPAQNDILPGFSAME